MTVSFANLTYCVAKLQNSCRATLWSGRIRSRLNSLCAHVCELHSDTVHVNTHIILLSCHVLVLLAVWQVIIGFKCYTHARAHTAHAHVGLLSEPRCFSSRPFF